MPIHNRQIITTLALLALLGLLVLSACNPSPASPEAVETQPAGSPEAAATEPAEPTAIPVPMAVIVNGQGVTLDEYNLQMAQLMAAAEAEAQTLSAEAAAEMLQTYFIESELLAQAAYAGGYELPDADLQARLAELKEKAGGEESFQNWLAGLGSNEQAFLVTYRREMAAQWQREQIAAGVGDTAEQIHARQILVIERETAEQISSQLRGGAGFTELAAAYDPVTKGDLGWFPRGYLFLPEIEEILFTLQPGQFTDVLESEYGYHIILVEEREANHPLSDTARLELQRQALNAWLEQQKAAAAVE
ncbi:MAG: peptidylprolyl isomerase, partial [Anaerolineaceae bacterium]